ncbi:hypothetical protein M3Y94_00400300 [Aphelenchoides besseyi]|nr:hypothetical protein M3Y94_00400300 [Aphelenchoides besseyi]
MFKSSTIRSKKGVVEIKILRPVPLIRSPLRILQKLPMANDISVTGYEYAICYLGLFEGFKLGLRICARYSKIYIREVKPKSVARKILKTGDAILVVDDVEVTTNEQAIERMEKRLQQKNWIELVVERPISHAAKECVRKRLREGNTVTINPGMPAEVREICEAQIERMNSEKEVECKGILRTEKYKTRRLSIAKLSQEIPIGEEPQLSQMLRPILNPEEQIDLIRCKRAQRRARRSRPSDSSNR